MNDANSRASAGETDGPFNARQPNEETGRLGREIYESEIRHKVEAQHHGEVIAIDVDSGRWALADSVLDALDGLRRECPDAVNVLFERVGHRTLYKFGGSSLRRTD